MQKVKRSRLTRGVCRIFGVLWLALLMLPAGALAANPPDWTVGDVFVAVGGGQYQIWHSANPTDSKPTYAQLVNPANNQVVTLDDKLGGVTKACAFDSAYRPFTTNSDHTEVVRFAIDNLVDVTNPLLSPSPNPVVQKIPGVSPNPSGFANTETVSFDGGGNLYVGYGTGGLEIYNHDATALPLVFPTNTTIPSTAGTISVDGNGGVDSIDVTNDSANAGQQIIFYVSQGRKIFTFSTKTKTSSLWADLSKYKGTLFAIRVLPSVNGIGRVLVADQVNVKLVQASGGVVSSVQIFKFGKDADLEALSLDPNTPSRAWVGDHTSGNFIEFDWVTGNTVVTLNTGTANGTLGGICVDGSFSPAQPAPLTVSSVTLSPNTTNTAVFNTADGSQLTATLIFDSINPPPPPGSVTLTLRSTFVDPSVGLSDPNGFFYGVYAANGIQTRAPGSLSCVQNSNFSSPNFGKCEVFELEANPNSGFLPSNYHLTLGSDFPCSSSLPGSALPCPNPRIVRNMDEDVTDSIDCCSTKTTKCIFTINQQTTPAASVCPGFSPATDSIFTQGSAVNFKFQAVAGDTTACKSGPFLLTLDPLLLLVQVPPVGTVAAPAAFFVSIKGNSGGPPIFTLGGTNSQGNNTTYQLQVDTINLPPGTYFWTVIDLGCTSSTGCTTIPAFGTTLIIK